MKKLILFLSLFYVVNTNAQTLKGFVTSNDGKPVEFANVMLLKLPDSTFQAGVITYTEGDYTLDNVKPGQYCIKSSYVGFQDAIVNIDIDESKDTIWAQPIKLQAKATDLDEVKVVGKMIRGKELVDRTVYSIPPELAETSTNGYEILRKVPSVEVDFNNNITLNGKSNFVIEVDGKTRDKEFLSRLLPGDIQSVEVIHNPSGKYEGAIDGVINIVLTQEARVGVRGNAMVMFKPFGKPSGMGNAGFEYGKEKVSFYVSGFGFYQNLENNTTNKSIFLNNDSTINNKGLGSFTYKMLSINSGFDYHIDEKNKLSLNVTYKPTIFSNELDNNSNILVDEQLSNYQTYNSIFDNGSDEISGSLYYKRDFEKPIQEFTIEAIAYKFNSTNTNDFSTQLYGNDLSNQLFSINTNEDIINERSYLETKVNYVHPVGTDMRLEGGYQVYYQYMDYDYKSNSINLNNTFNYNEVRNAFYLGWIWNVKKFGLQAVLRTEYSDINVNNEYFSEYLTFLPSTNIQYKINKSQNVKFTYNRRINRPSTDNLNPFEKTDQNQNISMGNPNLEPEHRDKLELKYTINFGKSFIAPSIYHEIITQKIGSPSYIEDGHFKTSPRNLLTGSETGLGLNAMFGFVNINGRVFKMQYDAYNSDDINIDGNEYYSFNCQANAYAPLFKKKVNVFAFLGYQGYQFEAERKTYSTPFYGFGLFKKHKNHSFGAFYFLPLGKELTINKTIVETADLYSRTTNSFDVSYYIQFQYSYTFNKGRSIKKMKRKTKVESDTKSSGIGM